MGNRKDCFSKILPSNRYKFSFIVFIMVLLLSWTFNLHSMKVGYSAMYDFNSCRYFCGRSKQECHSKDVAIVVYDQVHPTNMSFKQMDQFYVRNRTLLDMITTTGQLNFKTPSKQNCSLTDIDSFSSTLHRQNKCAVVGNSGILLNSRCGSVIDSNDFIIRANLAPVRGFVIDVGRKTNLMLVNDVMLNKLRRIFSKTVKSEEYFRFLRQLQYLNDTVLWYPKDATKNNDKLKKVSNMFRNEGIEVRLGFSLQDMYSFIKWKYSLWRYPSSGLYMVALAQSLCENVTLFGFFPYETDDLGHKVLRHYYEPNLENFHTWAHDFDAEYRMLISMRDKGNLKMFTSSCV